MHIECMKLSDGTIAVTNENKIIEKRNGNISKNELLIENKIEVVKDEITNNATDYEILIHEFSQSGYNGCPAILLYYSPALLSNTNGFFKKNNSSNSLSDSLKVCLPFMQQIMQNARLNIGNNENGVITIMLRDAAMVASQDPTQLGSLEMSVLSKDEAAIQKKLVKQQK